MRLPLAAQASKNPAPDIDKIGALCYYMPCIDGETRIFRCCREGRPQAESCLTEAKMQGVPSPEQRGGNASPAASVIAHESENQGGTV